MDKLEQKLRQLITEICTHPLKSLERQQKLSQVCILVIKSGKLWRENTTYYNDALQQMWEYCCQHPEEYEPSLKNVTTWLNDNLKKQLRNLRDAQRRNKNRLLTIIQTQEGQIFDPTDNIPARPDIDPVLEVWEATLNWVKSDPDRILRKTCFRKRSEVNAQALILRRLPPETPWQTIATEFQLTPSESKDLPKFYSRKCLPHLRRFGTSLGYINEPPTYASKGTISNHMKQVS
ncbi:MAG: sigma-70 family RNA polymerase sigma factor [Symploca sp. SIO1C4]|uniref:Sigma-70 family RNA polymerase sigma factor n=1 Tax=Symploca sp. SIO1C4 TaxID=2607765 RepID=A0A6B3NHR0_9CYAN|nr:sigma-70 family RNA polymerase sigma factor [Symploca sp. SIO1C4]